MSKNANKNASFNSITKFLADIQWNIMSVDKSYLSKL